MFIELFAEYGLFLAKVITFVIAVVIVVAVIAGAALEGKAEEGPSLKVKRLNERFEKMELALREAVMDEKAFKQHQKQSKQKEKASEKEKAKALKAKQDDSVADDSAKKVYVLDFNGDMKASAVDTFRDEITATLTLATPQDEVIVRLESPGGMVHAYGLASSQLVRFKTAGIPLTICVDKVAASGGYMMACIADKILSAPFAVIGSIGVVASIPNFNKVLKKNDVDYEMLTAGEYKRTLTMFGENTEAGREKFIKDLEETHELFKGFVSEYRPQLDIAEVATGETWYGKKAVEKLLVDEISTSDEYISRVASDSEVYHVHYAEKKNWQQKLGLAAQTAVENTVEKVFAKAARSWESKH